MCQSTFRADMLQNNKHSFSYDLKLFGECCNQSYLTNRLTDPFKKKEKTENKTKHGKIKIYIYLCLTCTLIEPKRIINQNNHWLILVLSIISKRQQK